MNIELSEKCCLTCKVSYWITVEHDDKLRRCHNTFYCPNGHSHYYPQKTEEEKLKEKVKVLEARSASQYQEISELERSARSLRGVITRMKKKK